MQDHIHSLQIREDSGVLISEITAHLYYGLIVYVIINQFHITDVGCVSICSNLPYIQGIDTE